MNDLSMRLRVGITDGDWFELLAAQPNLEEVNFWQPGGNRHFRALDPGELFLFKLHSPNDFIVGGGLFAHATLLPVSLAWDSFGIANGARTLVEMRERIAKYRREPPANSDYTIGCILLESRPAGRETSSKGRTTMHSPSPERRSISRCRKRCEPPGRRQQSSPNLSCLATGTRPLCSRDSAKALFAC